jgi:outer membrane protein assembly factor BamD
MLLKKSQIFDKSQSSIRMILVAFTLIISGCAGNEEEVYVEMDVEQIYNNAMIQMDKEAYVKAAGLFNEVERQHPYSVWATKGQIMAAYAQYLANKYDESIASLDRFIQLHPGHKDIAYAYFLKALCYYEQIADVGRDQKVTSDAMRALQQVVDRFPNTSYAADAKLKIDLARDHLAGKEMAIGRYYQHLGYYLGAINRYKNVLDNYQTTTHVPESLHRLVECYEAFGLKSEAKKIAAVLGYNYPGDHWYEDTYGLVLGKKALKEAEASQKKSDGLFDWLW